MNHLVSYSQIISNLRRTADNGLISLLNQKQLEDLAFKYFGIKDEYGNIIGYQCPYSGNIYTNYEDIVLEHIIPVISRGGTVLFNCIPTSKEVNGPNQKGSKHLINWWHKSKYWDKDAPFRLEKIVNYMLDGYNFVFEQYTVEEIESSYLDIEIDENILQEDDEVKVDKRKESKLLKQAKDNNIHSYLGFILDCINTLDTYNIDTTEIRNKLKSLEDKHIFEDIDRYQLYQNIVQKIIISRIGDDNRSYLTYTLNIDINKIINSINLDKEEDIYNEINSRLTNIENLLKENNLSTIEYFKSLKDIIDVDIIYKNINDISKQDINIFLENIKIGLDTKIEIFIQMLNKGNSEILIHRNNKTLDGHPNISLSQFWRRYQSKIKNILFEYEKNNLEFETARQIILKKYNVKSYEELIEKQELDLDCKIEKFINMLNQGNSEILRQGNNKTLDGHLNVLLSQFWNKYQGKIKTILFADEKDNLEFEIARKTILTYFKVRSYEELQAKQELDLDSKIEIFIQMLNDGNSTILTFGNKETLKGYPSIPLLQFWRRYQDKIKTILFEEEKNNLEYELARQTILNHFKVKSYEELQEKQDKFKLKRELDLDTKIEIFINMLNKGDLEILNYGNNKTLEGYPDVLLSQFWTNYQNKIKTILFEEEKNNLEYEMARQIILEKYDVKTYEELIAKQDEFKSKRELDLDSKIKIFITMLNKGNSKIITQRNNETLDGYPNIPLSQFWNKYQDEIKIVLFEKEKENSNFELARQTVLTYFKVRSYEELEFKKSLQLKITCFIKMLNERNVEILKITNKEMFKGYSNVFVGKFWHKSKNREIIIQTLFDKLKDNINYDIARGLILENLKVDTIEEYYEQRESKKKKVKDDKKIKKELEETIKMIDEIYGLLNSDEEQRKRA